MHQLGHFFAIAHLRKNMAEMHKKSQKDFKLVESGRKCRKWLESRLGLKTIFLYFFFFLHFILGMVGGWDKTIDWGYSSTGYL